MSTRQTNFSLGTEITGQSILRAGYITVGEALTNNARIFPDRVAIQYEGGQLTFRQLNARACRLANALLSRGVVRGDRVAILSENRVEYCETIYAASKIGVIVPCLNWRLSSDELRHCIQLTTPETILISGQYRDKLEAIRRDIPFIKTVVLLDEKAEAKDEMTYDSLFDHGSDSEPSIEVLPEDAFTIIYTSGTTGYPKAAIISHRAIFGRAWTWVADLKLTDQDTFLGWAPMFHIASMDHMLVTNIIGGKFICVPAFEPEKIAHYIWTERLGWLVLMPGTYEPMFDVLTRSNKKPVGVRLVGAMADLTPPMTIAEITKLVNAPFLNSFGSTETGLPPGSNSTLAVGKVPTRLSKRVNSAVKIRLVDIGRP